MYFLFIFSFYLFIYFFLLLFSGTQLRICVQVATPLLSHGSSRSEFIFILSTCKKFLQLLCLRCS